MVGTNGTKVTTKVQPKAKPGAGGGAAAAAGLRQQREMMSGDGVWAPHPITL